MSSPDTPPSTPTDSLKTSNGQCEPHTSGIPGFHAIIPAGGVGSRLWPVSRNAAPKFLHDILGTGRTLLQATYDRIAPLVMQNNTWVVTGREHTALVQEQMAEVQHAIRIISEPSPKDSAAAIGMAAVLIDREDPEAIVGSFSADHSITNNEEFREVITQACRAASSGNIVTIGITPTYPATSYGYIKAGKNLGIPGAPTARRAEAFVEKPQAEAARSYAYSGNYRWNAGMFIAQARVLVEMFAEQAPELYRALSAIAEAWGTSEHESVVARQWPSLEKKSFDYVIAEPAAAAGRVVVIPGDFGWDDVGDFDSIAKLRQPVPGEENSVISLGGDADIVEVDASGIVISEGTQERLVAVLGLKELVVVDTPDALLVASRNSAQEVKRVVERIRSMGREDVL